MIEERPGVHFTHPWRLLAVMLGFWLMIAGLVAVTVTLTR